MENTDVGKLIERCFNCNLLSPLGNGFTWARVWCSFSYYRRLSSGVFMTSLICYSMIHDREKLLTDRLTSSLDSAAVGVTATS